MHALRGVYGVAKMGRRAAWAAGSSSATTRNAPGWYRRPWQKYSGVAGLRHEGIGGTVPRRENQRRAGKMSHGETMVSGPDSGARGELPTALDRRAFMGFFTAAGLGGTLFPGVLWARVQEGGPVTPQILADAEIVAGLDFTEEEREMMLRGLNRNLRAYEALREQPIPNSVPPALLFDPMLPGKSLPSVERPFRMTREAGVERPDDLEKVAFWPVTRLSELIRTRQVSSLELTRMYLRRLEEHGPKLEAVISLTTERALEQAARADQEIANGKYRGPLHGIPWGAKDLLAAERYPTTWGAQPYVDQSFDRDATVVRRLEEAGAVLVAKLTLGALAMGDYWFGGRTRNPWNLEQGSSGSSAGSAAATTAGLVGFAIGSETLGSIVSPSTRTGASGLRPTFGRVSRAGAMALSWSMDKLGPLCRSAEDCALVLNAIHGADGVDPTARTVPLNWDATRDLSELRIGYLANAFEGEGRSRAFDLAALDTLRGLGIDLVPVELPDAYPVDALIVILNAEAGAAFDELTRSGRDDLLVRQTPRSWPNSFRTARMIPAVEYLQANRVRTMVMGALDAALAGIDVFVTPSFGGDVLLMTNLTGHPAVVVPSGFTEAGTPVSISFIGQLWGDADAALVAKAFQDATDYNKRMPPLFAV
jgi:Asp-tRNA(Asn)/Glu-tRNA(Gln) amidotransferase A subunit family amidase